MCKKNSLNIFTWPALTQSEDNLSRSIIGLWKDEMTTPVYIIPDTMGQLWASPRRSELVVVRPSAEMFPEADGK